MLTLGSPFGGPGSSTGSRIECWVLPIDVMSGVHVSLFRTPTTALVGMSSVVGIKDVIDHQPRVLNLVLTGEERSIAVPGVPQSRSKGDSSPVASSK